MSRNFTFGDASSSSPVRPGRKHRRGRGYTPPGRKNNAAPGSIIGAAADNDRNPSAAAMAGGQNRNNDAAPRNNSSHRQGGRKNNHPSAERPRESGNQRQPQPNYAFAADKWDGSPAGSNNRGNNNNNNNNNHNDETGSLTYSASSSVQSAESSHDSSFAEIFKVIGSEEDGGSEIKDFIAKQSKAANTNVASGGVSRVAEAGSNNAAVAGWMQRSGDRNRQQQLAQMQQAQQQQKKIKQHQFNKKQQTPSNHVDWNCSKDSSEEDVFGLGFSGYEEKVLETIAGKKRDEDNVAARHTVTITSTKSQTTTSNNNTDPFLDPFIGKGDPFQTSSSPYSSAPSSPRSPNSGHVTPPSGARRGRMTAPPDASPLSRTNSRHSKGSSSDGSWSPAPSSPPRGSGASGRSAPPRARGAPAGQGKTRRNSGSGGGREVTEDTLSEAFYAKSWMCGFTDSFNFDGFDTFQK